MSYDFDDGNYDPPPLDTRWRAPIARRWFRFKIWMALDVRNSFVNRIGMRLLMGKVK